MAHAEGAAVGDAVSATDGVKGSDSGTVGAPEADAEPDPDTLPLTVPAK